MKRDSRDLVVLETIEKLFRASFQGLHVGNSKRFQACYMLEIGGRIGDLV